MSTKAPPTPLFQVPPFPVRRFSVEEYHQSPVTLATSEPEPDVALVLGPPTRYFARHPGPADFALVIEVADTSLDRDRDVKGPLYADANIPTYRVVNIIDWVVEVDTQPTPAGYTQRDDFHRGDAVPLALAGQAVAQAPVVELLG